MLMARYPSSHWLKWSVIYTTLEDEYLAVQNANHSIGDKWLANKLSEIQRRIDQCANDEPPKYPD